MKMIYNKLLLAYIINILKQGSLKKMIPRIYNNGEPFLTGIDYSQHNKSHNVTTKIKKTNQYSMNNFSANPLILSRQHKEAIKTIVLCLLLGVTFTAGFIIGKKWS